MQRAMCCSCLLACACFNFSVFCRSFSNQACTYSVLSFQHTVMYFLISWPCSSWSVFSFYSYINNHFGVSAFFVPKIHAFHHIMFFSLSSKQFFIILQCTVWNMPLLCIATYLNLESLHSGQKMEFKPQYHWRVTLFF